MIRMHVFCGMLALLCPFSAALAQRPGTETPRGETTAPTLEKLIADLSNPNVLQRLRAAKELGNLGPQAQAAIPALQKALQDRDEDVRKVAGNALEKIQKGGQAPSSPALAGGTLTEATLATMLKDLGYDARTSKVGNQTLYTLTIARDTWTYIIEVSISPNQKNVWLVGPLDKLGPEQKNRAAPLRLLLEENWNIAPFFFSMNKTHERIYLQRGLENRQFDPALLRAEIEAMMALLRRTQSLWQATRWNEAAAPAGEAPNGRDVPRN